MAQAGAHRYWAIYTKTGYYGGYVGVAEVEFRLTAGGSDVTTPSTPVGGIISGIASELVDNNTGSYAWGAWDARITFDLGSAQAIEQVAIFPYAGYGPNQCYIEYSDDGSTWARATNDVSLTTSVEWQTIAVEQAPPAPPDPDTPQKNTPTLSVTTAVGWTNPNNVLVSDNSRASKVVTNTSASIITLGWTDSLPADALLLGCVLKVEGYASTTSSTPRISNCYFTAGGTNGNIPSSQNLSTTETLYTFNDANTIPTEFTSASRPTSVTVRTYQSTYTSTTHYIDYIGVELWWKLPGGGVNVLFIGELF